MKKIALVGYSGNLGGAGRALGRWADLLSKSNELEVSSFFFDQYITSGPFYRAKIDWFVSNGSSNLQSRIGRFLNFSDNGAISLNLLPTFFGSTIDKLDLETINLHWINRDMLSINQIASFSNRLVWTLHDPWIVNGLGNYPQYRNSSSNFLDFFDRKQLQRKSALLKESSKFISPTYWLADKLISCGLSEDQIKVIPNPIPFDIFKPLPKSQLRMKNNIGPDEICVLLASDSMSNDVRKGMDLANSILLEVSKKIRIKIVTFGHGNSFDKSLDVVDFGYIKDDNLLNEIYNLVDLTFVPSRIDNLPQIMTESLAAGTPVFSLPHGDAKLILKNELGFCSDVDDIAINVDDFLQFARPIDHQRRSIIAESARVLWNPEKIMKNYFDFI